MKQRFLLFTLVLLSQLGIAQTYTSYFTGDTANVQRTTLGGICLMGGATENDSAMIWLLKRSGGGDVVVIRASGANGYNDYLYTDLGITVNSVETLILPSIAAATDSYVIRRIQEAEMIWIAGGDQFDYVSYWKNTTLEDVINEAIHHRNVPIGGTSAGMAILGDAYFSAANNTVTSATALSNPYHSQVTLGYHDFLQHPALERVITDTHYDNPDRRGRHATFLAKLLQDEGFRFLGIAAEEYVAICIDPLKNAKIYGDYPTYDDFAYFIIPNCLTNPEPEICTANTPLTWDKSNKALYVCKIGGTPNGSSTFNLNDWKTQNGGIWENWFIQNGSLQVATDVAAPECMGIVTIAPSEESFASFYPNPVTNEITLELPHNQTASLVLYNPFHQKIMEVSLQSPTHTLSLSHLSEGWYYAQIKSNNQQQTIKFWKK